MELPAGGVFFYKYLVKLPGNGFKWQDGANNLLVLPEPWDAPEGGVFMADDDFGGVTREAQTQLAVKLISTEKEKVQLRVEANKAKEMTKVIRITKVSEKTPRSTSSSKWTQIGKP